MRWDSMKFLKIILCLFLLCGCSTPKKENVTEDNIYIVFASPLIKHEIWLKAKAGMDQACKELGYYCDWLGPAVIDTEEMNAVITTAIAQKADGIITQGVVSNELLQRAHEKGIPVVLVDSDMSQSSRYAYFGKNFHDQAEIFLTDIEKRLGKDTKLRIGIQVAEKDFDIAKDQIQEIKNVFSKHKGGYEIISVTESKSDKLLAKKEWDLSFQQHQYNVVINFAGESAAACSEVAEEKGIRDTMLIYGVDDMRDNINLIKQGKIDGIVVTSFYHYGYQSVYLIDRYRKEGNTLAESVQDITLLMVTQENVNTYEEELKNAQK